jgi:hypothetical protein
VLRTPTTRPPGRDYRATGRRHAGQRDLSFERDAHGIIDGVSGEKIWRPVDATGGALDHVLSRVRTAVPDAEVYRLVGSYPADDDNVYWVRRESLEVQIDTYEAGAPPFLIESHRPGSRLATSDPEVAVRHVVAELTVP